MKKLDTKEWIAVTVSLFVVGLFFILGLGLSSIISKGKDSINMEQSKLITQDVVFGTGNVATMGSRVTVHYVGKFVDGRVFDSSIARGEPLQFILGSSGRVIAGWDQGIVGMKVGGKRILSIPPELGYGSSDHGPIPGGSTLIFDFELLKVE